MDNQTILKLAFQFFFLFAVVSLLLSWILPKLGKILASWKTSGHATEKNVEKQFKAQEVVHRQNIQEQYDSRAAVYNKNILLPRDVEKRRKKEEDFLRFLGPAWKGNGFLLGGEDSGPNIEDISLPEGRRAAQRRTVREDINHEVATAAEAAANFKTRPKRVITLPEEPDPDELGVITVLLRTTIGTTCTRRFYSTHKVQVIRLLYKDPFRDQNVILNIKHKKFRLKDLLKNTVVTLVYELNNTNYSQCLLDFITTQGFSQRKYTISTTYPRKLLDKPDSCLADFNFGRRVVLNIEEKE